MGKHSKEKRNKKDKPKRKVSNAMLVLICIMIILYTASNFVLQYFTSVEVSPTLTNAWFAFWGTEIVALTAIKTVKVLKDKDTKDTKDTTESESVIELDSDDICNEEE